MYKGLLGGKPGRKNQNAQAKQHADELKKAEGSSSKIITEPMYRKVFHDIRKDWSLGTGQIIGPVMNQGLKDICWAVCFSRLSQANHNIDNPNNPLEFSYNDLINQVKPKKKEELALSNLKKAFRLIKDPGMLKVSTTRHGAMAGGDKGQRIAFDFDLYEDVDAAYIQQLLDDSYPVALRLQLDFQFSSNKGEIYYLPRKEIITPSSRLHSIILMGHGITKEGKLYFIGQNSWGTGWGCEGYIQIVIEEKCDIICLKH
ncbi:PREDICTED: cathepsin L1-like [Brassica oleracea var. oleracea]|uniref:Peptidase C1A papain C-terminal domain-containing protein n=1 Tax=Brassica oleracea var. oleracea TaxID=109376 RepID=A0A0D3CMK8_BRAOL|nr:PREDICTED: cathepsin L1-like [Brassica oleracea var. oleracea]